MKLVVAGENKEYEEGINITKLIEVENVETPDYVTVSVNDEFVDHDKFDATVLNDGDAVEFLYFRGGGQ